MWFGIKWVVPPRSIVTFGSHNVKVFYKFPTTSKSPTMAFHVNYIFVQRTTVRNEKKTGEGLQDSKI